MFSCNQLTMSFGEDILFKDVSLHFSSKQRVGLVGANGCGKSTFLKIISKQIEPQQGSLDHPKDLKIGHLQQDHFAYDGLSLIEVTLMGQMPLYQALKEKERYLEQMESDPAKWEAVEEKISLYQGYQAESVAASLLVGLGFAKDALQKKMSELSGGWRMRVLLAQLIFGKPGLLLLDEPTNHLDLPSIRWLERYLASFDGILVIASHDRGFLNRVVTHILEVDYQTMTWYPGNYDAFEEAKKKMLAEKMALLANQEKKISHMQSFVDRFGAKASKASQAQGRQKMIDKMQGELEANEMGESTRQTPHLSFPIERPSGAVALTVEHLSFSYGEKSILRDVSFQVERQDKLAIIGPNGAGKSTLLSLIYGNLQGEGKIAWGYQTKVGYVAQNLDEEFAGGETAFDWLSANSPTSPEQQVRQALGQVLFHKEEQKKRVNLLSGGEKARLMLAKMMLFKPNVLLLDEPTNHLDIEAIDALIIAIQNYAGTVILVSHSSHFLSQTATRFLEVTSSNIVDFKGNFALLEKIWMEREGEAPKEKKDPVNFKERKKERNQKTYLKRQLDTLEQKISQKEASLTDLLKQLESPSFYTDCTLAEQQALFQQEKELQSQIQALFIDWEALAEELEGVDS
ncbi:MAG: ABC-type transporter, ATPase subunit [Chlamydiales bacterium]|jgi:ATPase subunit of ABC transporter with duplicated ATPase domains|nr:ABC-type transporter, ATPase subunit [Chlamydiales bacterium]